MPGLSTIHVRSHHATHRSAARLHLHFPIWVGPHALGLLLDGRDRRRAASSRCGWTDLDISTFKGPKTDKGLSHSRTLALPPQIFDDLECIAYAA